MFIANKNDFNHIKYKKYRNILTSVLRNAEKLFYKKALSNCCNNSKKTWSILNNIIKGSTFSNYLNTTLSADDFNLYFSNVGKNLAKDFNSNSGCNSNLHVHYLSSHNTNTFYLTPVTNSEIFNIIIHTNNKNSTEIYNINMSLIKQLNTELSPILCSLFNKSFNEGVFPDCFKIAKVIPLHKKGNKNILDNFRPISLLPQFSKNYEKLFKKRLLCFINKYNILNDNQFGFRQNYSTEDALHHLSETVCAELENTNNCAVLSIDLKKAFDTLDHNILINKLDNIGIRGLPKVLLSSYLSNRSQYVKLNGAISNMERISFGVPQGSVLGPLLFLIYINDMPNILKYFTPIIFADDTNLIFSSKSFDILQTNIQDDLYNLTHWIFSNKLTLNVKKTKVMLYNIRNSKSKKKLELKVYNGIIEQVNHLSFLGIIIDDKCNWNYHINYIRSKLSRSIAIINKIKHKLPLQNRIQLYHSIFESHLNYCSSIWGSTFLSNIQSIIILQNRVIQNLFFSFNVDIDTIYKKFNLLKFQDNININILKYINRYMTKSLPIILQYLFTQNSNIYKPLSKKLVLPKIRTHRKSFCLTNKAPEICNVLPASFHKLMNKKTFKTNIKLFITSSY